jgi:membrane fusion protein, macrolide-specific efflux system
MSETFRDAVCQMIEALFRSISLDHLVADGSRLTVKFVQSTAEWAQVSGQLKTVRIAIGDNVKAGDLIAEIDPQIYEARLAGNEARLRTLEAQRVEQQVIVNQAQQMRGRNETLQKSGAVSKQAFEDAETALKIASAKLAAVEAQIDESRSTIAGDKASLNYTRIFAPMSGTVVLQGVRAGQTLNASQSAPTIVQLADLDTMTVRAQVAEADIMRLFQDARIPRAPLAGQSSAIVTVSRSD